MANNKHRYINTRLWNDNYVSHLDPVEKLLFIYFLTNEHTNISGIYEVPLKIIGIETGIDESMLKKILPRLEEKIIYIDGRVVIRNFLKHQLGIGDKISEFVIKGIINNLKELDEKWLKTLINQGFYVIPQSILDTLYIPPIYPPKHSNSNSNSNLVGETNVSQPLEEITYEPDEDSMPVKSLARKKAQDAGYKGPQVTALMEWAKNEKGARFVDILAQKKCVGGILHAGFTPDEIKQCWNDLEKEPWVKGIDFKMIVSQIGKAKKKPDNQVPSWMFK